MDSASLASSLLLNGLTLTATFTPLICKDCDHCGEHHHHRHGDRHHHDHKEGESVQDDDDGERDCL